MSERVLTNIHRAAYYQLIAVWVVCEAMLGGIIHGFRIPVSGLVVGSCAITCISLIGWYFPGKGNIIKATIIVAIFKMMLSPQAPPPAYIAVFFQGLLGELLFRNRKMFPLSCMLVAVLGLLESGLQRILVLTIISGNDLWHAINIFLNGLTKQKTTTNYSLLIGGAYVLLHLIAGFVLGWWLSFLPRRIEKWSSDPKYRIELGTVTTIAMPAIRKRNRIKTGLFILWIALILLYVQSYFKFGTPLLPAHISLKIFLRSLIIVLTWIFIVGPVLRRLLHNWLRKKQTRSQQDVQEVLSLLPVTQQIIIESWKKSAINKGRKRLRNWTRMILVNALNPSTADTIFLLSGPIQSGKTTALVNWSADRKDVQGIFSPIVNGKRVFMNAFTREQFPMEVSDDEKEVLKVGRFVFSKAGFEKAINIIRSSIDSEGWLVIDEIGPMELRGEGFHDVLKEIISKRRGKIILGVREGLVDGVKEHFNIPSAKIMSKLSF